MKIPGVYILRSLKNGTFYTGSTNDVDERLVRHNSGRVSYTANNRPYELARFITCSSITEAKGFEYRLKKYKRRDIIEKVINDGVFPWEYKVSKGS